MAAEKLVIKLFASPRAWETWLAKHHEQPEGIWLRMYKKDVKKKSVNYDQALDIALCYGWIDGQSRRFDEESWIQKFVHRRPRSLWSERNTGIALRLIKEKKMKPPGLKEIEAAKKDGRWQHAYSSSSKMEMPKDFLKELAKNKKAKKFFDTLNRANTYAIAFRLQTAKKPETRERRMKAILAMLAKEQRLY